METAISGKMTPYAGFVALENVPLSKSFMVSNMLHGGKHPCELFRGWAPPPSAKGGLKGGLKVGLKGSHHPPPNEGPKA